jgi:hypothetical protein
MPTIVRNHRLASASARRKLPIADRPIWVRLGPGIALGYRRNAGAGTWSVRVTALNSKPLRMWIKRIALADDYENSNGSKVLTYFEAVRAATEIGRRGRDVVGDACDVSLERLIATKGAAFIRDNIEPACYLYRHYDHAGDLLYVGISLSPMRRHEKHFAWANWRHLILRILIEPFASREEALQAEKCAIREEFPKFNATHNRRRPPAVELEQIASAQRRAAHR